MNKSVNKKVIYLAVLMSLSASAISAVDEKPVSEPAKAAPAKLTASAKLWSWQPVQHPAEPAVKAKNWVRTPIDAYVLSKLEAKGIKPSPETDRAAFIRRATLDAWGVIPTTEEVKAFVADRSPDAYEKLVDRLLASPHYGERQARRWLDLARYADSTGFQNDQTRPNMWRYRDYVINAFNNDTPYNRFIQEQLAGDELWPNKQEALVATGFLAGYPDNYNSRDLVQRKYQITTDMTDTVGLAFLGSTVGCARCHNHKTDKITQKDYFQLQAFFANTSVSDKIPAEKGEQELQYEQAQAKYQDATKDIRNKQKAILDTVRDKGLTYHKERYLTDSRESVFKPESEWNALDRWVNHRLASVSSDADIAAYLRLSGEDKDNTEYVKENAEKWVQYKKLTADLKKFDNLKPASGTKTISAVTELGHADSPPTNLRFAGVHERPLEEVQPAFPTALTDEKPNIVPTATSSGRRTALANWIASPSNPLTARVFVNRVWAQYFGHGIVETVSDFGRAGQKPSNPELLDYLADNFVKEGWSVKKLQRQILLSNVYRQSSDYREDAFKQDPENKLLAIFPRKRLEAEEIRDSLLVASGQLVDKIGGPSVFPPVPSNLVAGDSQFDGNPLWKVSKDTQDHNRRSIYVFVRRSIPYPLLESFDMANSQLVHSKRDVTTTPLQALTLFNSDVVFEWSQALAGKVISEAGGDESAQMDKLFQILFARNPDKTEKATLQAFLGSQENVIRDKVSNGKFAVNIPTGIKGPHKLDPIRAAAFVDLVHTVANSNEFNYRF
ncbi:MAG: DUF1549 and DUF1553 domain-containing protein [Pseudomonadota bacterium]